MKLVHITDFYLVSSCEIAVDRETTETRFFVDHADGKAHSVHSTKELAVDAALTAEAHLKSVLAECGFQL